MKLRLLLILAIPILFIGACQNKQSVKPVHYRTKVVKKVVHVRPKNNNKQTKPVPPVVNLHAKQKMPHYRILNDPVVVLTFHNSPNQNTGMKMTKYLNSIANINEYHTQISTSGNTTYVILKQYQNP